jgi:hypothetical protein
MEKSRNDIKCVLFDVDKVVIAEIIEVGVENIGEPDCKLINPFLLTGNGDLESWPSSTNQNEIMISSDKILTIANPRKEIIEKYLELTA